MTQLTQFDAQHYQIINERRRDYLDWLMEEVLHHKHNCSMADLGCGVGYFADHMTRSGFKVEAFDGREENLEEARNRYPSIPFRLWDIEDAHNRPGTKFELVLCFGLLYHLENPFLAIRNLHAVTGEVAIISTIASSHPLPVAVLYDEPTRGEAQALNFIALIPSEAAFVKMLYAAGFEHVYKPIKLPDHPDYQPEAPKQRTILVASKAELASPDLTRQDKQINTCIRLDNNTI